MRLTERNRVEVRLVKRVAKTGALGSRPEAFSEEKIPFRASLLPDGGGLEAAQWGMKSGAKIRLLAAKDIQVSPGDGVHVNGGFYIVLAVNRWSAHQEIICGARA